MDIFEISTKYAIPIITGGNHTREGWIQFQHCPYCGNNSGHLGMSISYLSLSCYTCGGGKNVYDLFVKKLGVKFKDFQSFCKNRIAVENKNNTTENKTLKVPPGIKNYLTDRHSNYIENKRKLEPDLLRSVYGFRSICMSTQEYTNSIYIPIYNKQYELVSYQCRKIQPINKSKYVTCSNKHSIQVLGNCLFGEQLTDYNSPIIVCEGAFDAVSFNIGYAVALFGKVASTAQLIKLAKYSAVYICLDMNAEEQAKALANELKEYTNNPIILSTLETGKDPNTASKKELRKFEKDIDSGIYSS